MSSLYAVKRGNRFLALLAAVVVAILILVAVISGWIERWLWMRQLDYAGIFWTLLSVQWAMFIAAFLVGFCYVWINLRATASRSAAAGEFETSARSQLHPSSSRASVGIFTASALIGLIFALQYYLQWDTWLRFRYGGSFGLADPLFGVDAGFYVFRLPFYELIQNSLTALALITFAAVLVSYVYFGLLQVSRGRRLEGSGIALPHLSVLLFVLVASWAWGFYLDLYELLYSNVGVVYGAGYTAVHVTRVSIWTMIGASVVLCALLAFLAFRPRIRLAAASGGVYVALYAVFIFLIPGLVQKFSVEPNELRYETPYLTRNIDFTRKAFKLDAIQEVSYPALSDLTQEAIARNEETIQNVRLWDWRPLLQTYRQTQEIRLYYQFYDVDVDRYHLPDGYHQVMLSARELSPELPEKARTWVNQYLQFTHGYGLVMSFVSKIIGGGFPDYLIKDIPPESAFDLTIRQPAIYYGEAMPGYRIVATGVDEFDYPKGNQNVYTRYGGKGGIPIDSLWKRLLFSWTQSDINILLTSYLAPESRIQIWRRVHERVSKITPFLRLDHDPYAVLSEGRLYWIQDAYTISDRFPYSTPYGGNFRENLNYIRNSVKVVVDMYDGTVSFYVMDPDDPILSAYGRAFPGVFRDLGTLPEDLKRHLRYPEDLFSIQADLYRTFHMTVPQVYYNQEDLWVLPQEKYAGTAIPMEPYYILMKLPGTDRLEYLLMTPFTPQSRDNMIAWMAARCDFPDYGRILVYQLPKEKLIYGPMQIEAMIDQNALISEQLSLWDQRGSRVIRGNLIVIPIENSFMYVEPVYLTAEGTNIPQLIRVIVVSGDKVVMQPTLDQALVAVFGGPQQQMQPTTTTPRKQQSLERARLQFQEAEKAMQQGDWEKFGKAMGELKQLLR
jgi:uncharacterized membrane protein (UPF0182 family)